MKVLIHIDHNHVQTVYVEGESEPTVVVVENGTSWKPKVRPLDTAPDWLAAAIE